MNGLLKTAFSFVLACLIQISGNNMLCGNATYDVPTNRGDYIITVSIPNEPFGVCEIEEEPVTLYDILGKDEIELIEIVVQHEVGGLGLKYKTLLSELIRNRLESPLYPDDVEDMLYQGNAFQGIARWSRSGIIPDKNTKRAVYKAFSAEETSHKATGYYNPAFSEPSSIRWFESGYMNFEFEYSETSWGVEYTTRFFTDRKEK